MSELPIVDLKAIRDVLKSESGYKISEVLGVSESGVAKWRNGGDKQILKMSLENAIRLTALNRQRKADSEKLEEPLVPYKKKKDSNKSKSKAKSKHKHLYEKCLLKQEEKYHLAEFCTQCGKINNIQFFLTKPVEDDSTHRKTSRLMTQEELLDEYRYLQIFNVKTLWQKHVDLSDKNVGDAKNDCK